MQREPEPQAKTGGTVSQGDDGGKDAANTASARRRSKKACTQCRARKVRCDVSRRAPCTNCEQDKTECLVVARKRRSRRILIPVATPSDPQNAADRPNTAITPSQASGNVQGSIASTSPNVASPVHSIAADSASSNSRNAQLDTRNHASTYRPLHPYNPSVPSPSMDISPQSGGQYPMQFNYVDYSNNQAPEYMNEFDHVPEWTFNPEFISQSLGDVLDHQLPRFEDFVPISPSANFLPPIAGSSTPSSWHLLVEPLKMNDLPVEDVQFLHTKGCLHIPVRSIFHELMLAYFRWVHPTLPMLSEGEFWSLCSDSDERPFEADRFSLFVLQAMLFAGCAFAPEEIMSKCGFSSIRDARHSFYRRAKLLFDLDTEKRPFYLSCGALLLAYHAPNKNERQVNSFWLEEAIRSARIAGAHRHYEYLSESPEYAVKLKKLWFSCIFRDRILPLGVRRPLQITSGYFTANPDSKMSPEDFRQDLGRSRVYDSATQKDLFRIFVLSSRLAEITTDLISQIYTAGGKRSIVPLSDADFFKAIERLAQVHARLDEWLEACTFQYTPPFCVGEYQDSVAVFANLLFMFHDGAMLALYNEMVMLWSFRVAVDENLRWTKIDSINNDIVRVIGGLRNKVQELVQVKLIKYLPVSICAFLMLPMMLHIFGLKSAPTPLKAALRRRQFEIHMETMRMQRVNFDGTDFVVDYLEDFARFIDGIGPVRRPKVAANAGSANHGQSQNDTIASWEELLPTYPMLYLRFVMHLDTTLSTGAYPNELAFPLQLQQKALGIG